MRASTHQACFMINCLLATTACAQIPLRIATFNVQDFNGDPLQLEAAADILMRINADVVCLQEMNEASITALLAGAAEYDHQTTAHHVGAFDFSRHNAVISRYPITSSNVATSITLSGDSTAHDLTRNILVAHIDIPGAASDLTAIVGHWKAGSTGDADEFRRCVESIRTMQAANNYTPQNAPFIIAGDMNDDIGNNPDSPAVFFFIPTSMPPEVQLGNDIMLPIINNVFDPLLAADGDFNINIVNALQLDGSDATRPDSGRRLDYMWTSDEIAFIAAEIYDSEDEAIPGGLPKFGQPLFPETSMIASDHLLVFADIEIPSTTGGACCFLGGWCDDDWTSTNCSAAGGTHHGDTTTCADVSSAPGCTPSSTDVVINEAWIEPATAKPSEFIELSGLPNFDLNSYTILVIEGDGATSRGRIDLQIPLTGQQMSSDGYFLVGAPSINPNLVPPLQPFLENGTQTILLVENFLPPPALDVDADNDGIAEADIGNIIDAVAFADAGFPEFDAVYYAAPAITSTSLTAAPPGAARVPNGQDAHTTTDWRILADATDSPKGWPPTPGHANNTPGDIDLDADLDLVDFALFQLCYSGPGTPFSDPQCANADFDEDHDVDLTDFNGFQLAYTQP